MENNREYAGDAIEQGADVTPSVPSIEVFATIKGTNTGDEPFLVTTPGGAYPMHPEEELTGCLVLSVPVEDFYALSIYQHQNIPVPVYIYDNKRTIPPMPQPPYVRVILSNAIITSDGEGPDNQIMLLEILAMVKAVSSSPATNSVTLYTPTGHIGLTAGAPAQEQMIYRLPRTAFTAEDAEGQIPVQLYDADSLVPPLPLSGVQIILTDLTMNELAQGS